MGIKSRIANFVVSNSNIVNISDELQNWGDDDEKDKYNDEGADFEEVLLPNIKKSLKNARWAASTGYLGGMIDNIVRKSITTLIIEDEKNTLSEEEKIILKHWIEIVKIDNLAKAMVINTMTDAETYWQITDKYDKGIGTYVTLVQLDINDDNKLIKKILNDYKETENYLYKIPKEIIKGNLNDFDNVHEETETEVTFVFTPEQIINCMWDERLNKGHSPVIRVLDDLFAKINLEQNQIDRINRENIIEISPMLDKDNNPIAKELPQGVKNKIEEDYSQYGGSKVIIIPAGTQSKMLSGNVSYAVNYTNQVALFERNILNSFNIPPSQSANESGVNRSTAEVTNDSENTGFVLILQDTRKWVLEYINRLFKLQLERMNIAGEINLTYSKNPFIDVIEDQDNTAMEGYSAQARARTAESNTTGLEETDTIV
jgi:hypothetical protein